MSKKLYRSNKDKMIGGVAAGLGDYFDIDHTLVRVLFVVTLFLGGTGVLAYIIMWIIVPEEPIIFNTQETKSENTAETGGESEQKQFDANAYYSALDSQREKRRIFAGAILVILGLMFLADNFIPRIRFGDFWPLILIGIGIGLLLNAKRNK
jgi:phage shock protein C